MSPQLHDRVRSRPTSFPRLVVELVCGAAASVVCAVGHASPAPRPAPLAQRVQDVPPAPDALPIVRVERDGTVVDRSCRLVLPDGPLPDLDGDGVVHIVGDDLVVVAEGHLRGAPAGVAPEAYEGLGIVVRGARVELRGARVSGFRVALTVDGGSGARVVDADVSDNRRQRLHSTHAREEPSDWLFPHANDDGEWARDHGAGLRVVAARGVRVERLRARDVQNGILFERVEESLVIGCDASFLSGWGLALWRSSDNRVLANRFDFCVRGYVHGHYNRGQDSAGVLLFEQSSRNLFEGNSLTHGGDGIFGFAGREALGDVPPPAARPGEPHFDHERRGCNGNVFRANDLSFAAAHGLELTFSFDARIEGNLFEDNAICGVWLGYGRDSLIAENRFVGNGTAGYGAERGAVNAEHGQRLSLMANVFEDDAVDVRLWSDADPALAATPWAVRNGQGARDNWIVGNWHLSAPERGPRIELVATGATAVDLPQERIAADEASAAALARMPGNPELAGRAAALDAAAIAERRRALLAEHGVEPLPDGPRPRGRAAIVVGAYGPYDHERPLVQALERRGPRHLFRVVGPDPGIAVAARVTPGARVRVLRADDRPPDWRASSLAVVEVEAEVRGALVDYELELDLGGRTEVWRGVLSGAPWQVRAARSAVDPRTERDAWRSALESVPAVELPTLDLAFGGAGPAAAFERLGLVEEARAARERGLADDHFGLVALSELDLAPGRYRVRTRSDDGLCVRVDGATVVEDWTWHGPTDRDGTFELAEPRRVRVEVEYFELDGHAELSVEILRE
jgi:parallel beta-helix repeat protein